MQGDGGVCGNILGLSSSSFGTFGSYACYQSRTSKRVKVGVVIVRMVATHRLKDTSHSLVLQCR